MIKIKKLDIFIERKCSDRAINFYIGYYDNEGQFWSMMGEPMKIEEGAPSGRILSVFENNGLWENLKDELSEQLGLKSEIDKLRIENEMLKKQAQYADIIINKMEKL